MNDDSAEMYLLSPPGGWKEVMHEIEQVFAQGGEYSLVRARPGQEDFRGERGHEWVELIFISGLPGRYILCVFPTQGELGDPVVRRYWWEGGPFKGKERLYNDDIYDKRLICSDMAIAVNLFKEFFDHKGITQKILDETVSVWDLPDDES